MMAGVSASEREGSSMLTDSISTREASRPAAEEGGGSNPAADAAAGEVGHFRGSSTGSTGGGPAHHQIIQGSPSFASSGTGGGGGSGATQTRFSFYNADDFKVVGPSSEIVLTRLMATGAAAEASSSSKAAAAAASAAGFSSPSPLNTAPNANPAATPPSASSAARRSFFISRSKRKTQHERQSPRGPGGEVRHVDGTTVVRQPALVDTSTTDNMVRSLQRKEQQRVELRQELQLVQEQEHQHDLTSGPLSSRNVPATAAPTAANPSSNNPYEDAIKEALDLLRRHRVALSPKALPKRQNLPHLRPVNDGAASLSGQSPRGERTSQSAADGEDDGGTQSFTPRHADRVLQSRGDDASSVDARGGRRARSVSAAAHPNALVTPTVPDTPDSSFLGEAYQAEIEARRRQRQERMAKYASRLAELKQDSDSVTPLNSSNVDAHSLSTPGRRVGGGASGGGGGQFASYHQRADRPEELTVNHEDLLNQHVGGVHGQNAVYAESEATAGTISTMTAGTNLNAKEAEVQRGVEKVLLAILERANHRSLSSQSHSTSGAEARRPEESSDGGDRPPSWQREEEKKSSSEEFLRLNDSAIDENSLVQAVSDLLGSRGSSSSSIALEASRSLEAQQPPSGSFRYSDMAPSIDVDDYDPISASRSMSDAGGFPSSSFPGVPASVAKPPPPPRHQRTVSSPLPVAARPEASTTLYATELTNTSDGQIEAVASDPGMMSELDELVRKVSDRSHEKYLRSSSSNFDNDNPSAAGSVESIDEKVRRLLGSDEDRSSRYHRDQEGSEEDESIENTSVMDPTSNASASSFGESLLDDDDAFEDRSDTRNQSAVDMVLGPLSRKGTGVVLEPDSPPQQELAPSILESLSAAVSLVVSGNSAGNSKGGGLFSDKYTSEDDESEDSQSETSSSEVSDSNGLMRSLCAHLLPVGVSQTSKILDKLPEWDESNPDEPGYRIVRLTRHQLRRVEEEFKLMVDNLKRSSEQNLRKIAGSDETFERDLKAAEELLNKEEERLKTTSDTTPGEQSATRRKVPSSPDRQSVVSVDDDNASVRLPDFPGVKRAGEGEMGDLEFFHLPIIFKSHVTGFEPTKDLCLESGNVIAGQYLVEGELGSAAFSTAYRCIDLNSQGSGPDGHEEVCLKVIKNTKDFFDQSLDEIKILELLRQTGQCREKCIVEMRTFFYHREHLIIVTELLKQNLFEFGKWIVDNDEEPYFTLPRLASITRQVLIALDFVHSLGLVHSDVKPENILLGSCSRARVKLIDFGSSCYLTDRQSSYIQSRSYRAPEVVLGLPYDGRIDVWSLGCVVAEMFTGEVTFQNDSVVSMLSRIEAICGPFPRHMIAQGRQAGRFFTKCGLLFERAHRERDDDGASTVSSDDEPKAEPHYDIFQPKTTTLAARLGFDSDLLDEYQNDTVASTAKRLLSGDRPSELRRRGMFVDFVRQLLTIDPESRPTAKQALQHPWMQYAASLTEDDIIYPSSNR